MFLIGFILIVCLTAVSFSVPTCNVSLWSNFKDMTCSGTPNSTDTAMNYNGNCTMFPNDPSWSTYKFLYDANTKTVQNFRVYNFKNCFTGNDLYFAKTPAPINVCVPAFLVIGPTSNVPMGGVQFDCTD